MSVIDFHTHYAPQFSLAQAETPEGLFGGRIRNGTFTHREGFAYPIVATAAELEAREAWMAAHGVDVSVLSLVPQMFFYDVGAAGIDYLRAANDELAALVADRPHLMALAALPLQDPEAAATELRRAVEELGMVGAQIGTSDPDGRYLGDASHDPLLEAAEALGVMLMLHPYYTSLKPGLEQYYLTNTVGVPLETTVAGASLILSGAFDRFPRLRVLLAHGGGFLPYQLGRLDHAARVRPEGRGAATRLPSEYLGNLWFDTITHAAAPLEFLARLAPGRIVVGSDSPFDMGDPDPVAHARAAGLDPDALDSAAASLLGGSGREPTEAGPASGGVSNQ